MTGSSAHRATPIDFDDPQFDEAIEVCDPIADKAFVKIEREILEGIDNMTYDRAHQLADWVTQLRAMTNPTS